MQPIGPPPKHCFYIDKTLMHRTAIDLQLAGCALYSNLTLFGGDGGLRREKCLKSTVRSDYFCKDSRQYQSYYCNAARP